MSHKTEQVDASTGSGCAIQRDVALLDKADAHGRYVVECRGADGRLKWEEGIKNLVTTSGKNDALDKYLSGSAYTAAWYMGLIGASGFTTGPSAGDTAGAHPGWFEDVNYSQSSRPTASFAAAASGSKSLSTAALFSITANVTIKGCFLITNPAKGGSVGVLYSAGLFSAGDKVVQAGDSISVSYTASL